MRCVRFRSRAKSTSGGLPSSPYSANCSASRTRRAALASTRGGTQPSFVQVPPMFPRSTSATSAPSSRALSAAVTPAGPPPTTTTSKDIGSPLSSLSIIVPGLQPERDVLRPYGLLHDGEQAPTQLP